MAAQPVEVSLAILYRDHCFLLQLRDEKPDIFYPGHWGLFGGHLEPGESPEEALLREIQEEISYTIINPQKFSCYADEKVKRHVYYAPLQVSLDELILGEGFDFGLISLAEIVTGECYSTKAAKKKPLGSIHQQILLDFLQADLRKTQ